MMLYEENVSSFKTSDSDEDARYARWPYLEGLEKGNSYHLIKSLGKEFNYQNEVATSEEECWD